MARLRDGAPTPPPAAYALRPGGAFPPDDATPLWLGCAWDAARPWPREPALGLAWRDGADFAALALMADSDVGNSAVGRNDRPWEKGDVLELFLQPAGGRRYIEVHVTPALATLEYAIPDADALRAGRYDEIDLGCDLGLHVEAGRFSLDGLDGWWGMMRLPLARVGIAPDASGPAGNFCLCRYNYNRAWGANPECSSTAPFPTLAFHQPACWHRLDIATAQEAP